MITVDFKFKASSVQEQKWNTFLVEGILTLKMTDFWVKITL